jgi:beta-lactamase superfamily II metal-dependent hydrolase
MGAGIDEFCQMAATYNQPPIPVDWGGVTRTSFCNKYPADFDDENNLSLVSFISYGGLKIVFPGDLEKAGWKKLLEQETFRQELAGVNVFLASHHGRQSGCCEEVFNYCKPDIVIFSDKSKGFQTQETVDWYANRCKGVSYRGSTRKVFTTRHDGNIKLMANGYGFDIATDKGLSSDPVAEALGTFLAGGVLGMGLAALRLPRM